MKILFRTIRLFIFVILITSGCSNANAATTTTSASNLPETYIMSSGESNLTTTSAAPIPARPEKREGESNTSYTNRMRQWEVQVRQSTSNYAAQQEANVPRFPVISTAPAVDIPHRPSKRSGESDASYNNRLRQWEAEVRRLDYENRKDSGEIPARPTRRQGESSDSYNNRLRNWESDVRRITSAQTEKQKDEELKRLKDELAKLNEYALLSSMKNSITNADPEEMLIIPSREIEADELLSINEDMNIMSRILMKELLNQEIYMPASSSPFSGGIFNSNTGINSEIASNMLNSMYLQGYGALFQIKADFAFPLVAPEIEEQQEQSENNEIDDIWEQTKQQLNEQQLSAGSTSRRLPEETKYNAQRVENLKKSFIQILKHASNIRALQPDESVTIRITETAANSSSKASIKAIVNNDQYLVQTETGIKLVSGKESLAEFIKFLPQNAIVIRAKKSDIDSFAKDDLDFDKFREKVQVFSYPVLNGISETIR